MTFIPVEGEPGHEFAKNNIQKRAELDKKLVAVSSQKHAVEKPLKALVNPIAVKSKLIDSFVTHSLYADTTELPEALKDERQKLETYIDKMVAFYKQIDEETMEYILQEAKAGTFRVDSPKELKEKYRRLNTMYGVYVHMEERARESVRLLIAQGVYGEEAQTKLLELYGSVKAVENNEPTPESLLGQEKTMRAKFEASSLEHSHLEFLKEKLILAYSQEILPLYHSGRFTTGALELDHPLQNLIQNNDSTIQGLWKRWNKIWRARPADTKTSLY